MLVLPCFMTNYVIIIFNSLSYLFTVLVVCA